jgi:predicted metal-dependent enzyme (double-stranded beta helix superfamily)
MIPSVQRFIDEVRSLKAGDPTDAAIAPLVAAALGELLRDPELIAASKSWPDHNDWDAGKYSNLVFYQDPDYGFVLNGLIKTANRTTPIHDHGRVWTIYGLLAGSERVRRYSRVEDGSEDAEFADLAVIDDRLVDVGFVDIVPPFEMHAEQTGADGTVAVIYRSEKVGSFLQNSYDADTRRLLKHYGPDQVDYALVQ